MKTQRICVKCKDVLGRQKYTHQSSKMGAVYAGSAWCNGPRSTPGGGYGPVRSPIHYRHFAGPNETLCGLQGGRMKGKYKSDEAQVPWGRIKVDLDQTTCVDCLAVVVQVSRARLQKLLKPDDSETSALERARGRLTMNGLRQTVGT